MPIELLPRLPISALIVVCPTVAALILVRREDGSSAAWSLVRDGVCLRGVAVTPAVAAAILLAPAAEWVSYLLPSAFSSSVRVTHISPPQLAALATAFLICAVAEIGWSGYALGRLRPLSPKLRIGLEIGVVWAAWHVVPLLSVGRSTAWVAWWSVATIAQRVVYVWLYRVAGRSVGVVAASHALHNLVWMLIPSFGSEYDPRADAITTVAVVAAVLAISERSRRTTRQPDTR